MDTSKLKSFAPEARVRLQEQIGAKLDYVLRGDSAELRAKASQVESIRKASETEGREAYLERIAYGINDRAKGINAGRYTIELSSSVVRYHDPVRANLSGTLCIMN